MFSELVPPDVEGELKNLYLSLLELLRHFWKSFPPTTPEHEATAVRMHEALQRFQHVILKPFEVCNITSFNLSLSFRNIKSF